MNVIKSIDKDDRLVGNVVGQITCILLDVNK